MLAYYMFCNHGWEPSKVAALSSREKVMLVLFAVKEIKSRPKPKGGG